MERELRREQLSLAWQDQFPPGLAPQETHPGHGGVDSEYDELNRWLDEQIKLLEPVRSFYTATFRAIQGQDELPAGIFRKLEVAWRPAGALEQ